MSKNLSKLLLLLFLVGAVAAFFAFDLGQYLTLEAMKANLESYRAHYNENPFTVLVVFWSAYVAVTALSLPGAATILTLVAGALFGVVAGTLVVSVASTVGATLAFLTSRFLLRNFVQAKFSERLKVINEGVEREGAFYLFALRLVPIFPFFVINLVMGLTPISVPKFFIVSQIGMLLGTAVYVNAGTQLAQIENLSGILSIEFLLSFAVLGVFPILAKKLLEFLRNKQDAEAGL